MKLSKYVEWIVIKDEKYERIITLIALVRTPSFPQALLHFIYFRFSFSLRVSPARADTAS